VFCAVLSIALRRFAGSTCSSSLSSTVAAGATANPNGTWIAQQARNLAWTLSQRATLVRYLIRDRDSKFTLCFDGIFNGEGIQVIRTPARAPQANAYAERCVGTIRRECLDWILIRGRRHLEHVLGVYIDDDNTLNRPGNLGGREGGSTADGRGGIRRRLVIRLGSPRSAPRASSERAGSTRAGVT